jgi:hypothetical protein
VADAGGVTCIAHTHACDQGSEGESGKGEREVGRERETGKRGGWGGGRGREGGRERAETSPAAAACRSGLGFCQCPEDESICTAADPVGLDTAGVAAAAAAAVGTAALVASRAATPGRTRPSSSSNDAPPPVEMCDWSLTGRVGAGWGYRGEWRVSERACVCRGAGTGEMAIARARKRASTHINTHTHTHTR